MSTDSIPDPSSTDVLLKLLKRGGIPPMGDRSFAWSLPKRGEDGSWQPGEWMRVTGRLVACSRGLHLCRVADLPHWIRSAEEVYLAEAAGTVVVHQDSKVVVRKARLTQRLAYSDATLRLWAADCAEHVLPLFEAKYPSDDRPRKAIEAARAYARGEITLDALRRSRSAADDAAYAAAAAAAVVVAAADADAAAAAADAARQQERDWQIRRLACLLGVPGYADREVRP